MHSQDDLAGPCEDNAEHKALAVVVELRNGSSDCRGVGPQAAHTSLRNGCRRSHCCHSKIVGEAYLDSMAASRTLPRSSRCFPWETREEVLEQEYALALASRPAAVVLVLASVNLIWTFRSEVGVLLPVLKPNQKGAAPVLEAARPDTVNVELLLRGVQRSQYDFGHLLRFQM